MKIAKNVVNIKAVFLSRIQIGQRIRIQIGYPDPGRPKLFFKKGKTFRNFIFDEFLCSTWCFIWGLNVFCSLLGSLRSHIWQGLIRSGFSNNVDPDPKHCMGCKLILQLENLFIFLRSRSTLQVPRLGRLAVKWNVVRYLPVRLLNWINNMVSGLLNCSCHNNLLSHFISVLRIRDPVLFLPLVSGMETIPDPGWNPRSFFRELRNSY